MDALAHLDLVRFHSLLHSGTNIAKANVNTCVFNASRCGILGSLQKFVVLLVKGDSKSAVYDVTVNLRTKIDLHHVAVFQDSL